MQTFFLKLSSSLEKEQEGPSSSCVVCSKGKQTSHIPAAWNTKEPATSPQVVLEIIYTGFSFQSFLFTIYQVIFRNAYYVNWKERMRVDKQKNSGGKTFLCVCTCMYTLVCACMWKPKIDVRNPLLFVLFLEASSLMWWAWFTRLSGGHLSPSSRAWITGRLPSLLIIYIVGYEDPNWSTQLQGKCFYYEVILPAPKYFEINRFWFLGW